MPPIVFVPQTASADGVLTLLVGAGHNLWPPARRRTLIFSQHSRTFRTLGLKINTPSLLPPPAGAPPKNLENPQAFRGFRGNIAKYQNFHDWGPEQRSRPVDRCPRPQISPRNFARKIGGHFGPGRAGRPAGHSKNGFEKHEIVMEMGRGEGLWADF